MDKHLVDFTELDKQVRAPKVYRLADVQHRITKVAFDIVRFRENEDTDQLWRIEDSVDGPVIVAMYDKQSDEKISQASVKTWGAIPDGNYIQIVYKGEAIRKIASSDFAGSDNDVDLMCRWLPSKLASDSALRTALIKGMSQASRELLFSKYPELRG